MKPYFVILSYSVAFLDCANESLCEFLNAGLRLGLVERSRFESCDFSILPFDSVLPVVVMFSTVREYAFNAIA